jgi:cysteine-rich repeat protein
MKKLFLGATLAIYPRGSSAGNRVFMSGNRLAMFFSALLFVSALSAREVAAASPCDSATHPTQCGWFDSGTLPPFVHDAIVSKGGTLGAGNVLVLTSGDPNDPDTEISNDLGQNGCGTNPDGWQTFDCVLMDTYVPPQDSVVLALSSEWFEWYQTIFTDWMTIAGAGIPTVDVSINSWINNKVDIIPYGPMDTGVVILTSLAASKMVNFRVADSGDHIYDTAIVVVPASWFANLGATNVDATLLCGNGTLEPGEDCDDGNTITDDGCSSLCLGTQPPPSAPAPSTTCGNLVYVWPNGTTAPYTCGKDLCAGYRCVVGNTISPACYTADQCAAACAGACVDVQTAQLDCSAMCSVQPAATSPPPVLPTTCNKLVYVWPDGTTMPYTCDDTCIGQRCIIGTTISPACYGAGQCDGTTCPGGVCADTPATDCASLCALAELPATCTPEELGQTRPAANQQGPCHGNVEICNSLGVWELDDNSWQPQDEMCNGLDDDCNGIADDMFVTCGDPGLCQNTVNTCDPADPTVPVPCVTLPPPSPVEICNDGLDNDCDGSPDDGCECGDDQCMPGETFVTCTADCPAPGNGTPCDDGDLCTAPDAYQNGVCIPGAAVTCDDGNACVIGGSCNPATGCSATKVNCDDQVACTEDWCDPATGCAHTPVDTLCSDGDSCTLDSCEPLSGCVHAPDPACQNQDTDGDGYASVATGGTDCDDNNAAIHPGAAELCNGVDDDCNGQVDDGFNVGAACQSAPNDCGISAGGILGCAAGGLGAVCDAVPPANPAGYGDACTSQPNACGVTAPGTVQCDGTCSAVPPAAADTDGDGTPDCLDQCPNDPSKTAPGLCGCGAPETTNTYYRDADADGFGNAAKSTQACHAPTGYVADNTDCNDRKASVHPGAAEVCNGIDDNCNGQVDENIDADGDGIEDCRADRCLGTKADSQYLPPVPLRGLGNNRWELRTANGKFVWATTPQKKPPSFNPTIAYTDGCSCKQILDVLRTEDDESLTGQYLFGCTKGTLEDWHKR